MVGIAAQRANLLSCRVRALTLGFLFGVFRTCRSFSEIAPCSYRSFARSNCLRASASSALAWL